MSPSTATARQAIDDNASRAISIVAGLLILCAAVYGLFWVGRAVYYWFSPPVTLSLSSSIEEISKGHFGLHVEGAVQQSGEPLNGLVVLSVQRPGEGSAQSFTVPLEKGKFELRLREEQVTIDSKDEYLLVSAEAWAKEHPHRPARSEVYLNASSPLRYKRTIMVSFLGAVLVLGITFCWVFTGRTSALKNRVAIILSYLVMALFLTIPLVITNIAIQISPGQFKKMEPVGFTVGHAWGSKPDEPKQWVLNIGGYLKEVSAQPQGGADNKAQTSTATMTTATPPDNKTNLAGTATSTGVATAPASNPSGGSVEVTPRSSSTLSSAGTTPNNPSPSTNSGAISPISTTETSKPEAKSTEPEKELEGGLAIPFYVLVLAAIGGAINMARQVPKYHQEAEESVVQIKPLEAVLGIWGGSSKPKKSETELTTTGSTGKKEAPESAGSVEGSDSANTDSTEKRTAEPSGNGEASDSSDPESTEKQTAPSGNEASYWRTGLLYQYMYLVSAPFLAMITYFLLAWLGTTTVPALVLVSFSVGLITQPVIQRIIAAAQGIIGGKDQGKDKGSDTTTQGSKLDVKGGQAPIVPSAPRASAAAASPSGDVNLQRESPGLRGMQVHSPTE